MLILILISSVIINENVVNAVQRQDNSSEIKVPTDSKTSSHSEQSVSTQSKSESKSESKTTSSEKSSSETTKQSSSSHRDKSVIQNQSRDTIMPTATIDDGVTGWQPAKQTTIASIDIDKAANKSLNYTFGNSDGTLKFDQGNGGIITNNMPPRMNVFIKDNGKIVESSFKSTSGMGGSYDYSLLTTRSSTAPTIKTTSTSAQGSLTGVQYYQAKDAKGQTILKMVGQYTTIVGRVPSFTLEYLLRPSLEKPSVQQELYIYNATSAAIDGGIFFAKDTSLNGNDGVPVSAQGNNAGMYIADGKYKLFLNMGVEDGPAKFNAMNYHRNGGYNLSDYAMNDYSPANFDGTGIEVKNLKEGATVYSGSDSAYSAKWNWQTFQPDTVYHFRNDLGIATAGLVVPEAAETYKNKTTSDQKNHVQDNITIEMKTHNLGYSSEWKDINVTSKIPDELDIDPSTIKVTLNNGDQVAIDASKYNQTTRMLTVRLPKNLAENEWSSISFDAKINGKASGKTINSSMVAKTEGGTGSFDTATASTKIPVEVEPVEIEKKVLNETEKETTYQKATVGHVNDVLDYQVKLTVSSNGADMSNGVLADDLAKEGLELVPGSVKLTYSDKTVETPADVKQINLKKMTPGQNVVLTYKAKVKEGVVIGTVLKNIVLYSGEQANQGVMNGQADASVTIEKTKNSDVHFSYIDRETGQQIANEVVATGPINAKISALKATDISDGQDPNKIRPAYIEGYTPVDFTTATDLNAAVYADIKDVDPVIEEKSVTYTFRYEKTRLAITALPSKLNFGKFDDTQSERTFYLPAQIEKPADEKTPYGIEISDYWGIKGWTLSVAQEQQFHGSATIDLKEQVVELSGAQLQFNNATLSTHTEGNKSVSNLQDKVVTKSNFNLVPGAEPLELVEYERKGQYLNQDGDNKGGVSYDIPGYSVHKYQFGDARTADYSIGLHVPETTERYRTEYTSTLKWHLTVAP